MCTPRDFGLNGLGQGLGPGIPPFSWAVPALSGCRVMAPQPGPSTQPASRSSPRPAPHIPLLQPHSVPRAGSELLPSAHCLEGSAPMNSSFSSLGISLKHSLKHPLGEASPQAIWAPLLPTRQVPCPCSVPPVLGDEHLGPRSSQGPRLQDKDCVPCSLLGSCHLE